MKEKLYQAFKTELDKYIKDEWKSELRRGTLTLALAQATLWYQDPNVNDQQFKSNVLAQAPLIRKLLAIPCPVALELQSGLAGYGSSAIWHFNKAIKLVTDMKPELKDSLTLFPSAGF